METTQENMNDSEFVDNKQIEQSEENEDYEVVVQMRVQTKTLKQELDKVHQQDVDDLFKIRPFRRLEKKDVETFWPEWNSNTF